MALRGLTLVSKFLLIFFLARFLEPIEVGLYGLVAATTGYALYLVGFDFYTYTTRELLKTDRSLWGRMLKGQFVLTLVLYAIFGPVLLLIFASGLLPWAFAGWFFVLLALEHFSQELSRLLITISEPLWASIVLFLRSGIWAVVVVLVMWRYIDLRSLGYVLTAWAVGGLMAVVVGAGRLTYLGIGGWRHRVDWGWVTKGLKIALPLLIATLAIRGLFTVDRYWFEALVSREVLGAYVLFMGMSTALMSFLDAGVFAFIYPSMISAYHNEDPQAFMHHLRQLLIQTVVFSLAFAVVALLAIDPVLTWLDRPLYMQHRQLFYWLLLVMFLYAIGMIPHYALYAQGKDRPIIVSHSASILIFVVVVTILTVYTSYLAVPLALCVTFAVVLLWKTVAFYRVTPLQYRRIT